MTRITEFLYVLQKYILFDEFCKLNVVVTSRLIFETFLFVMYKFNGIL